MATLVAVSGITHRHSGCAALEPGPASGQLHLLYHVIQQNTTHFGKKLTKKYAAFPCGSAAFEKISIYWLPKRRFCGYFFVCLHGTKTG
jgi:hypothetical protein